MKLAATFTTLIALTIVGTSGARADEVRVPPPTVPPPEPYWTPMTLSYIPAVLLVGGGAALSSPEMISIGLLDVALAPPIIHLAQHKSGGALAAVGIRILFTVTAAAFLANCDSTTSRSGGCKALAAATLGELIAIPVLDFVMASRIFEDQPRRPGLAFVPRASPGAFSLSLAGRF